MWFYVRLRAGFAALTHRVRGIGERGQGMMEYAIIGAIIIVGTVAAISALSGQLYHVFSEITSTLSQY